MQAELSKMEMENWPRINNPDSMRAAGLKTALREAGKSQREMADFLGISETMLSKSIAGTRKFRVVEVSKMARFLNLPVKQVLEIIEGGASTDDLGASPLVGYVGAGETVFPIDDHEPGAALDFLEMPPGESRDDLVAVQVRGDSMHPVAQDGWWLFFRRDQDGVPDSCIRKLCVVKVANDGPTLVKTVLKEGANPGRYILNSYNAEPMINVALDWAAPVEWVRPTT